MFCFGYNVFRFERRTITTVIHRHARTQKPTNKTTIILLGAFVAANWLFNLFPHRNWWGCYEHDMITFLFPRHDGSGVVLEAIIFQLIINSLPTHKRQAYQTQIDNKWAIFRRSFISSIYYRICIMYIAALGWRMDFCVYNWIVFNGWNVSVHELIVGS